MQGRWLKIDSASRERQKRVGKILWNFVEFCGWAYMSKLNWHIAKFGPVGNFIIKLFGKSW